MSEQTSAVPPDPTEIEGKIKTALRGVYDPELGMSVIELGMIRQIQVQPDLVEITMILTTPFCPIAPQMMDQVRTLAEKAVSVPVRVRLGTEVWNPSMMEGGPPSDWGLF